MATELHFPSKYLKGPDLKGDTHVTIARFWVDKGDTGEFSPYHLAFAELPGKELGINKTNAKVICKLHGNDGEKWVGKRITIYPTEVEFGGDTVLGIRVRTTAPGGDNGQDDPFASGSAHQFGPSWSGALEAKVGAVTAKFPAAGMESLRRHLMANQPGASAAVVNGSPMNWDRTWMDQCKAWLAMDHSEAVGGGSPPDDSIPFSPEPGYRIW